MTSSVNGCGRIRSHLSSSARMCSSPRESQIACSAGTSSTAAKALSIAVKPTPAFSACRCAQWLPLVQLGAVGEVAAELDEERAEVLIDAVEVEVVDLQRRAGQPQVLLPGRRVAALLGP